MARKIAKAVTTRGNVQPSDVCVSPLTSGRGDLNTVWIQCPIMCADQMQKDGGLRIGWSRVLLVPLAKRRLQCYRCFAVGHTRANCRSAVNKSNVWFNCGGRDIRPLAARPLHCPVYAARNLSGHRAGRDGCAPYNRSIRAATSEGADNSNRRNDVRVEKSLVVRKSEAVSPTDERVSVDAPNG
ncbi:PREDICTED: uncharacterized protein LOC105151186 [Acromyrmex echinatior]|uniref:uncharacterized protein LOC105151186 n=1 Tax=Acromyrmex echinatior TaxID=103372 RepID=UPI000580F961|nr:PREDICTED: uncharacterized protein LOC105151186 [Acromyrmex echinatior]